MKLKSAGIFLTLISALAVLSVTFVQGRSLKNAYLPVVLGTSSGQQSNIDVAYNLPFPGRVMPDNPLWYLKALRDKLIHLATFGAENRTRQDLICADKRLEIARLMLEKGKPDLSYSTLVKGEMYLEGSLKHKNISIELLQKVATSSLKHREVIEEEILPNAPEDLKPEIIKAADRSKNTYKIARDRLRSVGSDAPNNPFEKE